MKQNRLADKEARLVAKGEGRDGLAFGISRCRLVHREQINKISLYSRRIYIQYPKTNHNGKEYEKESVCVRVCKKSCIRRRNLK